MNIKSHPKFQALPAYKKSILLFKLFLANKVAKFYPQSNFIAICGSVGKTLTAQAVYSVLSQTFKTIIGKTDGESFIRLVEQLLKVHAKTDLVVLEFGLEYPGEMQQYLSIAKVATAVVTRIDYEHSLNLGNIDQIFEEYKQLLLSLPKSGLIVLNWDDAYVRKLADDINVPVIFYGTNPKFCHVWADKIKVTSAGTYFELNYGVERTSVNLKAIGRHTIYAALAAACLGIKKGMSLFSIKKGLEKMPALEQRVRLLEGINQSQVLDDTYSCSPASLEAALNVLNELPARRRIAVIGEMKDLGSFSAKMHTEIARKIFKDRMVDYLLLSGQDAKIISDELTELGYLGKIELGLSHSQIVSYILSNIKSGDVVLVTGDRSVKFSDIVQRITNIS